MISLLRRPEVTIAVPMFRAVDYLATCLGSIADQTYDKRKIEVLCIDDGSPDATVEEAQRLMKKLKLHGVVSTHPNTGTPATGRNAAIDAARGHYIYFLDADDYLGPKAIQSMTELGNSGNADIVIGRYVGVGRGVPQVMFRETLPQTDLIKTPVLDSMNVLKMYRTEFARSLGYRFNPAIKMAEDHPFAMAAYVQTDRIAIQAEVDCYYCVRHTSSKAAAQHLTGHVQPVDEFYAYFYEVFGVLDIQSATDAQRVRHARDRYWNRLFSFDIPIEMRRNRTETGRRESVAKASSIMEEHGGSYALGLGSKAQAMQRALLLGDVKMVEAVAKII